MLFDSLIQRKLASLLRPWLAQEPHWEVRLGFCRSFAVARNLRLDVASLNRFIGHGDGGEMRLLFKSVTVDEITFRLGHWSAPAFTIEIHGVHVTLSPQKLAQVSKSVEESLDDYLEQRKRKILAEIDPGGITLHDSMEKMMMATSKTSFKNSITNLLLMHCSLHLHDVRVRMEFLASNDDFAWSCHTRELNAGSSVKELGCLFGGLIGLPFLPSEEIYFKFEASGLEIGAENKDHSTCILSSVNPFLGVKLKDLDLVNVILNVPEMNSFVSPAQLKMVGAFINLLYSEYKKVRSGRLLWKIARFRIHNLLLPPGYLLYKVVLVAVLWLRLVREYQYFLDLVGYSKVGTKVSNGRNYCKPDMQRWKLMSEIEKQLPAEAITSAWRVARYRAALREPNAKVNEVDNAESPCSSHFKRFWKILLRIWDAILKIVDSIMIIFLMHKNSPKILLGLPDMIYEAPDSRCCFQLSFGKISAVISSVDARHHLVHKMANLKSRNFPKEVFSFCLLVEGLLFIYEEGICEHYMSFSIGFLEGTSLPFFDGQNENDSRNVGGTIKGSSKNELVDSKTIVWTEPALLVPNSEDEVTETAAVPSPEQMLGEMELLWRKMHARFERMKIQCDWKPWAMCDIRTFLVYPALKSPDTGFSKCSLVVGKLNSALAYSSVLLMATLTGQMQHAFYQFDGSQNLVVPSHSSRSFLESQKTNLSGCLKSSVEGLSAKLFGLLPDKPVEVRAAIAGPHIQILVDNEEILNRSMKANAINGSDRVNLTINLHDSHFAAWPTAESGVASCREHQRPDDLGSEIFKLPERMTNVFSEPGRISYASKRQISLNCYLKLGGLNAYFENSMDKHTMQFLILKPMIAKFSVYRDYLLTFGGSVVASSLSFYGDMTGGTGLFYMDELSVILQVVGKLISAVSIAAPDYFSLNASQNQVIMGHQMLHIGSANKKTLIEVNEGAALNVETTLAFIKATLELGQFGIIIHNTRNGIVKRGFSDAYDIGKLGLAELPDNGLWFSLRRTCINFSLEGVKAELAVDLSGFHTVIFVWKNQFENVDRSESPDVDSEVLQSIDCLQEISLSTCTFTLMLDAKDDSEASSETYDATSTNYPNDLLSDSPSTIDSEGLNSVSLHAYGFSPTASSLAPSPCLLINGTIDVVFMGTCSIKSVVLGIHPVDKLRVSLLVGRDSQITSLSIQGGIVLVETKVLSRLALCFALYLQCISTLLFVEYPHRKPMEVAEHEDEDNVQGPTQRRDQLDHPDVGRHRETFSVDLSQLSLALLATDESGAVKEIMGKFDFTMKLWLEDRRKFLFNLSYLDILSRNLDGGLSPTEKFIPMPHFSPVGLSNESLWLNSEDSTTTVRQRETSSILSKDASCSSPPTSVESSCTGDAPHPVFQDSERAGIYILQQFAISVSAEKPLSLNENDQVCSSQGWIGSGSVSGLNMTVPLSDIKLLMSAIDSLLEVSGKDAACDVKERNWLSINQKPEKDLEVALPDGAIVAIQDVHQHMYVTVESVENKFRLAGAAHYSLAGKRALFKVKWQKRRWNFSAFCFSLTSLCAKSDAGDSLRLNYSASSGFVDISCNNDSACALWKIASCKHESYEDDVDMEPLNNLYNASYYLVNKKNDCAVAFIDDAWEFVKKPGNPFKFKVFDGLSLGYDPVISENHLQQTHGPEPLEGRIISDQTGLIPCITLAIEKASLTIVHELLDAKVKYYLLQGCINDTEVTVQTLPHKIRVMSTLTAVFYYFDVHRVVWRELVHPTEIWVYFRSRVASRSLGRQASSNGNQSRFYIRMKELELSLTELSLDILLYVIGKLDLAGPFAVKNSAILANRCMVQNQTEQDLFCQFYDAQSARVGRKQSAFFFLRNQVDQPSKAFYATFRLETSEVSSTSSIHVPLGETRICAWRSRIMSSQDGKTSPGPLMVFDVLKNAEEGLTIVVSPLLRICNQTGFPVELRIQRPEQLAAETASVLLRDGETVDDCVAAFDAVNLFGGPKKALLSLGVGNFMFSFRPEMKGDEKNSGRSYLVGWSDNLKGGKAVHLSGVIDKLGYQVRKTFSVDSWKYSFSTASCSVGLGNANEAKMHFLVQSVGRDVPIVQPGGEPKSKNSSIALQEQKEIFLLPTVRVCNLLESDVDVLLTDTEFPSTNGLLNINQATISHGLTVDLYANPAIIYFTVTLLMFGSSCKPVNCGQWLKKLNKKKDGIPFLDIDLEFCSGKYFACLRFARDNKGILEAFVFSQYTLRNETDFPLSCAAPSLKPLSRDEMESAFTAAPYLGSILPPKSVRSWFLKSSKLRLTLLDEESSETVLDLDALSGLAEISFTQVQEYGLKHVIKFGVSLAALTSKLPVPSRVVSIVPRYVISNESDEQISVRQCFLEDDLDGTVSINGKQKTAVFFKVGSSNKQDVSVLDKLLRKHRISNDDASIFVQFRLNETGLRWSGPVCVASLGHFFLKFRKSSPVDQSDFATRVHETTPELAVVHVTEEASTFVLHFHRRQDINLPYRIENHLHDASITYYQKDTFEPETLSSGGTVNYVWDDLTRHRKLMVKINGINMLREISLDKLRSWKLFFRARQQRELASNLPLARRIVGHGKTNPDQTNGVDVENIGYEVYADGPTRVLRICDSSSSCKGNRVFQSCKKIQFRISYFSIHLLERNKQALLKDVDPYDVSTYTPIVVGKLENISLDSIFIDQRKYNQIVVHSMNVDEKWIGAPYAAMLRRHLTSSGDVIGNTLFAVFVLYPTSSSVQEVAYSSIVLQPIDLNIDEETLMKIVPFWRKSLSTNAQSRQYYFDHFEIHPVKIIANFLPDDSYSSYSSGQETLRSLLHSVIKIPAVKNMVVELNGVLVTHALVTIRELLFRCAQHYSWYTMRAIYIAKGSPLLPPTFASVFDDLASSSLDVFFDPSSSLFNVRGLTLGTFKLVSKCIQGKGLSGTKRYFGDLSKTLRNAGSNVLFAAVTEISDSVLKGAESSGINGMVTGFHHGILKLAMEPSFLGTAFMEGGPDRKIILDRSPGVDELYIEGYLQAMLDTIYKQEYLRVRVIDNQVILKNLPPNSSLMGEIMDRVKEFLVCKALLKGNFSASSRPLRHLRGENEWRFGPTLLTLCEHLFVSFAIRMLRKQTENVVAQLKLKKKWVGVGDGIESQSSSSAMGSQGKLIWRWGIGRFVLSALVAYIDGRLCRNIPNPVARRIVSGFLLSFLDTDKE